MKVAKPNRLKQIHLDLLAAIRAIKNADKRESAFFKYINVWDSQIDYELMEDKPSYVFNTPAAFIEFAPGDCKLLANKISSYPKAVIRLHIAYVKLHAREDMEQNLEVFDVKDRLKTVIANSNISFCSTLMCCEDRLDFRHGNLYKHILAFETNFIDDRGSMYDNDALTELFTLTDPTVTVSINPKVYANSPTSGLYINNSGGNYLYGGF